MMYSQTHDLSYMEHVILSEAAHPNLTLRDSRSASQSPTPQHTYSQIPHVCVEEEGRVGVVWCIAKECYHGYTIEHVLC